MNMFLREVAKIEYLLTSQGFFASELTGISSWPLPQSTGHFVAAVEIFEDFKNSP